MAASAISVARSLRPVFVEELALEGRPAQPGLDAAAAAAIALRAGPLVVARQRQGVVAPFAADRLGADQRLALDHDAAAHAGAQDDAEHDRPAAARAVGRLGDGKAVGVVRQPHLVALQQALEVAIERMAVQLRGVGVLDQAGGGRDRAGMADADAAARAHLGLELAHHGGHAVDGRFVAALRRRHAHAGAFLAAVVEDDALDFRAPEIDADTHVATSQKSRANVDAALHADRIERLGQP